VLRGQCPTSRQESTGRKIRWDSPAAKEERGPDRPCPSPGQCPAKRTGHPAPSRTVRAMQAHGRHGGHPPRPHARRPQQIGAPAARTGPAHGQKAQEKPHRLRRLPRSNPRRATNRDTHAVVTGEPDARKASPSGSGGGRRVGSSPAGTPPDGLPRWSGSSLRQVANGTPKASQLKSPLTTSPAMLTVKQFHTGSTIWATTAPRSRSVSTTTRQSSPLPPSKNGGSRWVRKNTPMPAGFSSPPTAADPTGTAPGCGSSNLPGWLKRPDSTSPSATTHPEPANGTRSSTGSSPESPATGADGHSKHTKPSSTSSLTPRPLRA
jgi:hypothetical protein